MMLPKIFRCLAPVALVFSIAGAQPVHRVDDATLKNAGKSGDDWLTYGFTPGETRYSPLDQINPSNVKRLGLAWCYDLGAGGGGQEATPLVWNGAIYGITNWSVVFAVDARTGKERWRWDPEVNQNAVRPAICCGVVNRGIAHLSRHDHRADYRRPAAGAGRGNRKAGLGGARRVFAGRVHHHHGAAHRQAAK